MQRYRVPGRDARRRPNTLRAAVTAAALSGFTQLAAGTGVQPPWPADPIADGLTLGEGPMTVAASSPTDLFYRDVSHESLPAAIGILGRSMDVEAVDVDGDGDLDWVVAKEFGANVLLLNDGRGRFADDSAERLPRGVHDSEDIGVADFDGDGDPDLVSVSEDDGIHELYLNDGRGYFSDGSAGIPLVSSANTVLVTDLDGDGDADLLLGNAGQNRALLNDGAARFADRTPDFLPAGTETTQDLALGDVDGDGDLDLVEGNEDGNRLLLNDGGGRFAVAPPDRLPLPAAGEETRGVELGDVDADGDLDLFLANVRFARQRPPQDRLLLNDGQGRFRDVTADHLPVEAFNTAGARLRDLDADGDLDLLLAFAFGGSYGAWRNDGAGRFEDATAVLLPGPLAGDGVEVQVADVDGDGLNDLYLCNYTGRDFLRLGTRPEPTRWTIMLPWAGGVAAGNMHRITRLDHGP